MKAILILSLCCVAAVSASTFAGSSSSNFGSAVPIAEARSILGGACKVNDPNQNVNVCCNGVTTRVSAQMDNVNGFTDGTSVVCGAGTTCKYTPLSTTKCGSSM